MKVARARKKTMHLDDMKTGEKNHVLRKKYEGMEHSRNPKAKEAFKRNAGDIYKSKVNNNGVDRKRDKVVD